MTNPQKNKGNSFERELAAYLNANCPLLHNKAQRAPMSGSFSLVKGSGGSDLLNTTGLWVEAKRVEKLNFPAALAQARRGSAAHHHADIPVVINRRNRQPIGDSYVLLGLDDFLQLYNAWLSQLGRAEPGGTPLPLPLPPGPTPLAPTPQLTPLEHPLR